MPYDLRWIENVGEGLTPPLRLNAFFYVCAARERSYLIFVPPILTRTTNGVIIVEETGGAGDKKRRMEILLSSFYRVEDVPNVI
jgi:hypothetical protein